MSWLNVTLKYEQKYTDNAFQEWASVTLNFWPKEGSRLVLLQVIDVDGP
jgi:hypothetical protein